MASAELLAGTQTTHGRDGRLGSIVVSLSVDISVNVPDAVGGQSLVERAGGSRGGPFLIVLLVGRRRRRRRTSIAKNDRQTVFAVADDDCFRICGLRKLKRRLDAAPAQIGIRNALTDS